MHIAKPQAVIFDMDGLMLDTEAIAFKAYDKVKEVLSIEIPLSVRHKIIGRPMSIIPDILREGLPEGTDIDQVVKVCDDHYHYCLEYGELILKPGLKELLDFLESREVPRAVATSARKHTTEIKMRRTELDKYFNIVVTGDQVLHGKPAPDLFLETAKRLGKEVQHCLVLEDSKVGVLGATAAGMQVINIPDVLEADQELREAASHVCKDLFEVLDIFYELDAEL